MLNKIAKHHNLWLKMTMDLSVQYSTNAIKNKFNLSDFANGTLANQGYI